MKAFMIFLWFCTISLTIAAIYYWCMLISDFSEPTLYRAIWFTAFAFGLWYVDKKS